MSQKFNQVKAALEVILSEYGTSTDNLEEALQKCAEEQKGRGEHGKAKASDSTSAAGTALLLPWYAFKGGVGMGLGASNAIGAGLANVDRHMAQRDSAVNAVDDQKKMLDIAISNLRLNHPNLFSHGKTEETKTA